MEAQKHLVIKSRSNRARMVFRYNKNGCLVGYDLLGEYTAAQESFIHKNIDAVFLLIDLRAYCIKHKLNLVTIVGDLSFDSFWNTYNHKVGNKPRAKTLWDKLPVGERTLAIEYITRYNSFLTTQNGISKAYPETYLAQQRWHNED